MEFGERLIELRKEKNFTRKGFADYIGIPSTTLRNYETGVREPGHIFLKQMADIFNVSIDYLLGITEDRTPAKKVLMFTEQEVGLIRKYRLLDNYGQDLVKTVLDKELDRCQDVEKDEKPIKYPQSEGLERSIFSQDPIEQDPETVEKYENMVKEIDKLVLNELDKQVL